MVHSHHRNEIVLIGKKITDWSHLVRRLTKAEIGVAMVADNEIHAVVVTDLVVINRAVGVCNRRAVINPNVDRRQENYAQLLADAGEPKFLTQPSAARIDFNSGQRDIGRQVLS